MALRRHYVLTLNAEEDFREAKNWSLSRWGQKLTTEYFQGLHQGAEYIALNQDSLRAREDLTGDTGLGIHAVREHYLVYVPTGPKKIAIVALIRQTRDVPTILKNNAFQISRALKDALGK